MIHRHLAYAEGRPTEDLPSAAIVDILERGDLGDWRPIAVAVARDPLGPFASRVLALVSDYPMYGTSPLWRHWIDRCRARAEGPLLPGPGASLAELRKAAGLTQAELAARMGMSQSDLSKFERRKDVRVSTLRAYVAALGGELRVEVERGGVRHPLDEWFGERPDDRSTDEIMDELRGPVAGGSQRFQTR